MNSWQILTGDVREMLKTLEPASVQTCVTSPPYWGLRDYGTAKWDGTSECDHVASRGGNLAASSASTRGGAKKVAEAQELQFKAICGKCGARRIDNQLGLESTPDAYVSAMVEVFREVRRVLKDDGTVWLNLGDSYAGGGGYAPDAPCNQKRAEGESWGAMNPFKTERGEARKKAKPGHVPSGLKPKDLVGIPWMVAFALRAPWEDWLIRDVSDRAWLAALIDGEGTMTILETESPHGSGNSYPPVLQVRMCDIECIEKAAGITGYGKASPRQDPPSQGGVRGSYQWRLNGQKAARVAADIYPHLLIKRKQAIVVWNHQKVRDSYEVKKGQPIPRAAVEKQQMCRDLIRRLNKRESVDIPHWMDEPSVETVPGWYLRSDVIWSKPNPMPESVTDRPTKAHEYLFLLAKSQRYYYDAAAIAEATTERPSGNSVAVWEPDKDRASAKFKHSIPFQPDGTGRNKRSVWTVTTQPYPDAHFATYPEKLIEPCIIAGSRIGDTVLDPFTGSGTTGAVAIRHQRNFIGCELNPEYVQLARKRIGDVAPMFAQEVA